MRSTAERPGCATVGRTRSHPPQRAAAADGVAPPSTVTGVRPPASPVRRRSGRADRRGIAARSGAPKARSHAKRSGGGLARQSAEQPDDGELVGGGIAAGLARDKVVLDPLSFRRCGAVVNVQGQEVWLDMARCRFAGRQPATHPPTCPSWRPLAGPCAWPNGEGSSRRSGRARMILSSVGRQRAAPCSLGRTSSRSNSRRRDRPRQRRDLTVPTATPRVAAISSYEWPWTSDSTTTAR